jgi:hypothetical protein
LPIGLDVGEQLVKFSSFGAAKPILGKAVDDIFYLKKEEFFYRIADMFAQRFSACEFLEDPAIRRTCLSEFGFEAIDTVTKSFAHCTKGNGGLVNTVWLADRGFWCRFRRAIVYGLGQSAESGFGGFHA